MNVVVQTIKLKDGKTISDVVEQLSSLPYCFFLSTFLRSRYKTASTLRTFAYLSIFHLRYFIAKKIDIVERVANGDLLSNQECEDFFECCSHKVNFDHNPSSNIFSFDRMSSKQLLNMIEANRVKEDVVSTSTAKMRLSAFKHYVEYLWNLFHSNNTNSSHIFDINYKHFQDKLNYHSQSLKKQNGIAIDPLQPAIPDDIYFYLLEVIKPSHDCNPFSKSVRLRNQLIIQILNETGIRVGALAKLKISDIKAGGEGNYLIISRSPNDKTDPRKNPASQKTKQHVSGIHKETMKKLLLYIETEREKLPLASTHDFIFVSAKGKTKGLPIAKNSINDFLGILSGVVGFHLYPHLFRHKWNDVFEEKANKQGYSPEQIEDMRKYACGWSENSEMSSIYNEFRNAQRAVKMSKLRQSEFTPSFDELNTNGGK